MNTYNYLKCKYVPYTKFKLVHKDDFIITQDWVYLDGLKDKKEHLNVNNQFNEYYLEGEPIKTLEDINNKYWLVDGHHRYFRGILNGYEYFLVENSNTRDKEIKCLNVYTERPKDNDKLKKADKKKINLFEKLQEKIMRLQKMIFW